MKLRVQFLQGEKIGGDVLPDRSVRTTTSFHRPNPFRLECIMTSQEFAILLREDVIGHGGDIHRSSEPATKLEHEGGLAAAHRASDAHGKRAPMKIAVQRLIALVKMSGVIQVFVSMSARTMMVMVMMTAHKTQRG